MNIKHNFRYQHSFHHLPQCCCLICMDVCSAVLKHNTRHDVQVLRFQVLLRCLVLVLVCSSVSDIQFCSGFPTGLAFDVSIMILPLYKHSPSSLNASHQTKESNIQVHGTKGRYLDSLFLLPHTVRFSLVHHVVNSHVYIQLSCKFSANF